MSNGRVCGASKSAVCRPGLRLCMCVNFLVSFSKNEKGAKSVLISSQESRMPKEAVSGRFSGNDCITNNTGGGCSVSRYRPETFGLGSGSVGSCIWRGRLLSLPMTSNFGSKPLNRPSILGKG